MKESEEYTLKQKIIACSDKLNQKSIVRVLNCSGAYVSKILRDIK